MRVTNIEFFDVETPTMDIEVDKVHIKARGILPVVEKEVK